ncbi:MAG: FAD/NAD(P)-binding protein [Actinobacteria bacterium]|nr:FAD/NAD(P)-binding protein [Actinomycetota bacterium]
MKGNKISIKNNNSTNSGDPYLPEIATVKKIIRETPNIISMQLVIDDGKNRKDFSFEPGQVGQISVFGFGESTFVINSPASNKDYLQFSVMKAGVNTTAIHNLSEGEKVGLRAPLGNWFPYKEMERKKIIFVGGGIGLAPLRPLIFYMLASRDKYEKLTLLSAAKTPDDFCFKYDIEAWERSKDIDVVSTIDTVCTGWDKEVGLCPNVLEALKPSPVNTIAIVCGPPIMIKYTLQVLDRLGFEEDMIYTTLERRMKCGIGKCGRCNIGEKFVCLDGPVFTLKELNSLSEAFM